MTNAGDEGERPRSGSEETRLAELEAEVEVLRGELGDLRDRVERLDSSTAPASRLSPPPRAGRAALRPIGMTDTSTSTGASSLGDLLRGRVPATPRDSISGDAVETWVGRYGTLIAGAFVILLGVGTLVVWAVQRGLLAPELRVGAGAATTACVAAAGMHFRRRGEQRYGNVLLALSLAMTDVVAWGAGPRLHLVSTGTALAVVDLVAVAVAALAVHDESEFLFAVAVAGALSAPFVTSARPGRPEVLLAYGAVVLLGAIRTIREPTWRRAAILLVGGAAVYELAAAGLPTPPAWFGPFLIPIFGALLAAGALVLGDLAWRGVLARAFLAVALMGVLFGWDAIPSASVGVTAGVAVALLSTAYAALWVDRSESPFWEASALVLPLVSLGVALARADGRVAQSAVFASWGMVAVAMWRAERWRASAHRGGAHLLLAVVLVAVALTRETWPSPLALVVSLGMWGVATTYLARDEASLLPSLGIVLVLGGATLSAVDQLASLEPYRYVPFGTRASASALAAVLAVSGSSAVLGDGRGTAAEVLPRPARVGATTVLAFAWGRMELAHALSHDAGTFLLTLYYAATGVAAILAGRSSGSKVLRVTGLAIAIYAAAKAVIEATDIGGLMLRVGCYAAVGMFLFGAGYLYRNAGAAPLTSDRTPINSKG
jgi:hypothetical protein